MSEIHKGYLDMDDSRYKIMSQLKHFVCPACEKGILTAVAEVGIESEGSAVKFQSLSAAQGGCTDVTIVVRNLSRLAMNSWN